MMKAWTIKQPGGRDQLIIKDQPLPTPTKDEVLVKVDSTAINRTDIMTREDSSLKAPYPILGVEISGIVEKEVPNYPELKRGTRVAGLVNR